MPIAPTDTFALEKAIWTDADFDVMGWHDVHIHGMAFHAEKYELLLDIDYIYAWVDPEPPEKHFTFWMAPCTMIFSNVHSFTASVESGLGLEISELSREDAGRPRNADYIAKEKEWKWLFDCQEGDLSFLSVGFQQFTRRPPVRAKSQVFGWDERGGVTFDCIPYEK